MTLQISYPDLPIVERRQEILQTIESNQVVVVAGETGSGKSTQLPKFCLELGRGFLDPKGTGRPSRIGHTQPRRIAARSVAERVASELDSKIGETVGYAVRFHDEVSGISRVKVMTDGILLAEIQRDRLLGQYDTLIIDEAHERSLNIDFLLGWLKQLLPQRPDLKLIITSATIDTEKFSEHFSGADGPAPIIEVSGRTYPVDVRWHPLSDGASSSRQAEAIAEVARTLTREGPGDILVFLSGERAIRDAEDALTGARLPDTEIFPLYARLSSAEQHRVFEPHSGRRIVLATNVAETSLTVPGIRYVIDPGLARISRYSHRTKVQRLPIEAVSQASANQRAGRCGRLGPGICVRLYSEEDFETRPEFTEPEIQRTNLASVILQMAALGLGDVAEFPFVDPPDERSIKDGVALLTELGALDPDNVGTRKWLTPMGRKLAKLPLDPRLARMVVEADANGCLDEVLIIVAGMSIIDPRERPSGKRAQADEAHQKYMHEQSDFLSWLELWAYLAEERRARSGNQFRKWAMSNYLHFNRIREWQDVHRQLKRVARDMGLRGGNPIAQPEVIHRSVLAGLLSQIGMKDEVKDEYRGARGARFAIAPGSTLHKRSPDWVMAGELVETSRLWARTATRIQPEWVEDAAEHLVTRSWGDPWWASDRGSAYADERVTLFGLPLIADRPASLATLDRTQAREMFIHHALIEGDWELHFAFMDHNAEVMAEVAADEARHRRDVMVDYNALYAFYDERVGPDVVSGKSFERWWKTVRSVTPELLHLSRATIVDEESAAIDRDAFPDAMSVGGIDLALDYEFDPTSHSDGVTVNIPVAALNQMDAADFEWNVPGLREDLVTALIRALPKEWRKLFVPVPETVAAILPKLDPGDGRLVESVRRELSSLSGRVLPLDVVHLDKVEDRLRPTFRVVDEQGRGLAESKYLDALDEALNVHVREAIAQADRSMERSGMDAWECGALPAMVETEGGGHKVKAYPALVDEGTRVGVALLATPEEQARSNRKGVRRLLVLNLPSPSRHVNAVLSNSASTSLSLARTPYPSKEAFIVDCQKAALNLIIDGWKGGERVADAVAFDELLQHAKGAYVAAVSGVARRAAACVQRYGAVDRLLRSQDAAVMANAVADATEHLDRLVYAGFVSQSGARRLSDVERYLLGLEHRLQKLPSRIARDAELMRACQRVEREVWAGAQRLATRTDELTDLLWSLEEFRVSSFAQQVGTKGSVSAKRIRRSLKELIDPDG